MTSRDLVNIVQRRMRPSKVGHAGTLDPSAEGVLVLGVGPAVRLISYVQQQPKRYRGRFRLGVSSRSGDLEEKVTEHPELPTPTIEQLKDATAAWSGEIEQVPPAHSAIWIDGRRAYERVRRGETVQMPARRVMVHSLKLARYEPPDFELDIDCGSGTYIRTLGMDVATAAGSTAVMTELLRVAVGSFQLDEAIGIDRLREQPLEPLLRPTVEGVGHLPRVVIDANESTRLGHGLAIEAAQDRAEERVDDTEAAAIDPRGQLRAIVRARSNTWRPVRVFPPLTED